MLPTTPIKESVATRLYALLDSVLSDGTFIPAMYHPIIKNIVKGFLRTADESDLRNQIKKLQTQIIPYILGEDESNQNK